MSSATVRLPEAIASPAPRIEDPTYSGCANHRYGPEDVTSRDLFKWPAAQIRNTSPAAATALPASSVAPDGCESHTTSTANTNPSGTRRRARRAVRSATPLLRCRETTLDGGQHFADTDVEQAHAIEAALAQVMALAHGGTRDRDIVWSERTVALGPRRTVDADQRRAHRRCNVRGTGVARHHHGR